jgi:hypothetical protein
VLNLLGCLFAEHDFCRVECVLPTIVPRRDVVLSNQHADDGLKRQATRRDVKAKRLRKTIERSMYASIGV